MLLRSIETLLKESKGYSCLRMDGEVPIPERGPLCDKFNTNPSIFCFLVTIRISGVGLNLVGADRAIIIDPDWNPANDNQAIDRIYRIGQKRDVIVYRLVSCNSVEETVYKRQIYKGGLGKATLEKDAENTFKYFSNQDLFQILVRDKVKDSCHTLDLIANLHGCEFDQTPTN